MKKITRQKVDIFCKQNGIELEVHIPVDRFIGKQTFHVHAYAPQGKTFDDYSHNISCWDSYDEKPDWSYILQTLNNHPLTNCTNPDCEVCE